MTDVLTDTGLKFFGTMTASISHELKNRFAIVNEQAGLLTDFVRMAERGRELDPERLMRLGESLKKQVSLADDLLGHMNHFSHSVDQAACETDIAAVVACIAGLARRTADRRNALLDLRLPETPPMAHTSGFLLMNLIWILLDGAMGPGTDSRSLTLSCESSPEGTVVRMDGAAPDLLQQAVAAATDLSHELGAQVSMDPDCQSVSVLLPR
ncbi:MAG: hypothetical protein JEZ11_05025 [Desulfobacterales bacterium]|nr:hypothetical protein [Desulfobacterales bacterium]